MPDITPLSTGNESYTSMDVLAADIRDLILEPLALGEADGFKFKNEQIVRVFNRAVKQAIGRRKGLKAWFSIATTAGTSVYNLPSGTIAVYGVNYKGKPLNPVTSFEKDISTGNSETLGDVLSYSLDNDPVNQITLLDAPTADGTTDLKVYALYYPVEITSLTAGDFSPLPAYYDEFLRLTTAGMLLTPDANSSQDRKYGNMAIAEMETILSIEEPRTKDPVGDRFRVIDEFYPGEM